MNGSDGASTPEDALPQLFICISCRCRGTQPAPEGEATDGRRLYDSVMSLIAAMGTSAPVKPHQMLCFANCERGCTAGISAPGKWSYIMGELTPEQAEDLLAYCAAYARSRNGVVLPSGRPPSMQKSVIARFPSHFEAAKDAAE